MSDYSVMRAAIAEAMRSEAELDSLECPQADIAQAFNDLKARKDKAEERLARELAVREKVIADTVKSRLVEFEDLQASLGKTKSELDDQLSGRIRDLKKANAEIDGLRIDIAAVSENLAQSLSAATSVLEKLLMRPHRLMEIYGQETYQAAKDTFCDLGGDHTKLPAPEVNFQQEKALAAGDQDAD